MRINVIKIVITVVGLIILVGTITDMVLESAFPVEETMIARVTDPTGNWEGIIVQRDAGATVSISYSVRIRKAGSNEQGNEVLLIDKVEKPDGLAVSWVQDGVKVTLPSHHQVFKKLDSTTIGTSKVKIAYIIR